MINTPHCITALLHQHLALFCNDTARPNRRRRRTGGREIHVNDWPVASKFREGHRAEQWPISHVNEGNPHEK